MIEIFGQPNCIYCTRAIDLCKQRKLRFVYLDITVNPENRNRLFERGTFKTVPQIFVEERYVGGFEEFNQLVDTPEFQQQVGGA